VTVPRGRPRQFDLDEALDRALEVFWRKGYEGTSLPDLTEALGINRPSLYAAFGSKEGLFRRALDRYFEGPGSYVREALKEPTARGVAERVLGGAAELLSDPRKPKGCLAVQGALACGEAADSIRQELIARRAAGQVALRERFERAVAEGDLVAGTDCATLARYLMTVMHGMAVLATGGVSRDELLGVAEMALRAWPGNLPRSKEKRKKRPGGRADPRAG
jgi:AcrR family transcriptional regulator